MNLGARLFSLLGFNSITPAEIRAEAWALGGRYLGEVAAGARRELALPGLDRRRGILLRAVLRSHGEGRA